MRISDWSSDVCSSDLSDVDRRLGKIVCERDLVHQTVERRDVTRTLSDDRRRQIGVDHHLHRLDAIAASPWSTGRSSFAEPRDAAFSLDLDDQECLRADLCRSEEHTSELQSLMRISYAV